MNVTHVFKLPSGVECEVKELNGEHQELLTKQGANRVTQFNKVLADIVVRCGSVTGSGINEAFASEMLTPDRNWAIFQARQFSLDFPEVFELPVKYKNSDNVRIETSIKMNLSDVTFKPFAFQVTEYSEIVRDYILDVKKFGKIRITLPDGIAEKRISSLNKKDITSSIDLKLVNPVYFEKNTPISVNLKKLGFMAIEDLRKQVMDLDGKVYADFEEEHPDADNRISDDKIIRGNLLGNNSFIFPSGAFS